MKIYTKTGDVGETGLFGGRRISKAALRIEAYGTLDELNAFVGLLQSQCSDEDIQVVIRQIQDRLFTMGSSLAADPGQEHGLLPDVQEEDVQLLEREIDRMESRLAPLQHFILPGGHRDAALCHVLRTVCRRAERRCVELQETEAVDALIIKYLNRLSDYFFVLSRYVSQLRGAEEVKWLGRKQAGKA